MTADADLLIGLDVGTTHVKGALIAADGHALRIARRPTVTHRLPDGGAVHHLDEILAAVDGVMRDCIEAVPANRRVAAIGVASMAEAGAPIDGRGVLLADILAWHDPRPAAEARTIAREVGAGPLFAITGLRAEPKVSLAKLLWLRRHGPPRVRRARSWAGVAELVVQALTGVLATSPSLACRTMVWDLRTRTWHPDLLRLGGLEADAMPEVLAAGQAAGELRREAALRLGLPSGIPVAVAGHDHLVGAVAAGVGAPGRVLDSLGTAEAVLMVTEEPQLDDAVRRTGFSSGAHPLPGLHYLIAGLPAAGALVEWFVETFAASGLERGTAARRDAGAEFERLLESAGAGPTGIVVDPAFRGRTAPSPDPGASGMIRGLRFDHGLPDLALATIEGVGCQVRWMLESLETLSGRRIEEVRLIGGAARSPRVRDVRAALYPWPLAVCEASEAVAVGAALLGGLAAGAFPDVTAVHAAASPAHLIARDRELAAAYDRHYRSRFLPAVGGAT